MVQWFEGRVSSFGIRLFYWNYLKKVHYKYNCMYNRIFVKWEVSAMTPYNAILELASQTNNHTLIAKATGASRKTVYNELLQAA